MAEHWESRYDGYTKIMLTLDYLIEKMPEENQKEWLENQHDDYLVDLQTFMEKAKEEVKKLEEECGESIYVLIDEYEKPNWEELDGEDE